MAQPVQNQALSLDIINLLVLSPEETLYSGEAKALTCHNERGAFDVLPLHTNFISLIDQYLLIHLTNGETKKIDINRALMKAMENNITVLLNIDLSEQDVVFKALFKQVQDNQQTSNVATSQAQKK